MLPPEDRPDTPAQLRAHAATLRDCARRAQGIAAAIGPLLDKPATTASTSGTWLGQYAQDTTVDLGQKQRRLRQMADNLLADARGWSTQADRNDTDADDIEKAKAVAGGHP
ncbi:hypothetical protein [Catenulispora pinisilvae]|uniref:hypothetical protein n=1 Tax=Catenulispora pinisilvae TaxID=2705253 RepID=UPI001890EE9C|nr:hypothetical protein [Catenulispora pinisilvae]